MPKLFFAVVISALLIGCAKPADNREMPPRGLKVYQVMDSAKMVQRRFPSVLAAHDETQLSFDIGGQLGQVELQEGQRVARGELLLQLDTARIALHRQDAKAALAQAQAGYQNARSNFTRHEAMWQQRVIPRARYDDAEAALATAAAQLERAEQGLALAEENLRKSALRAPFDGIVANVRAKAFATVAAGQTLLTLYSENAFEVAFSVPSSVINSMSVGQAVAVQMAELGDVQFEGQISEVGSRAASVSAFPVVAVLDAVPQTLRVGMSAEVIADIALPADYRGFLLPLNCLVFDNASRLTAKHFEALVYVYDAASQSVVARPVTVSEVRGNEVIVSKGLSAGDRVAAAGVSYLRDGMKVKLLEPQL
ncbi:MULTISPECIES: efflux RND transporter periplasmic adaptor subunit [unclassified Spongiibacter]|uniref:efflux RND transporter periplasmic adaptor subunit n=2 Tax=Spongiibacteraceae TaxID=1706375 RepID=UPI000C09CBB8|nr:MULTISPECIES: efflux RND transporter periplasmic adaptor subunit [unclassified Spongiibacter]MAK44667.1 hypothetical protein [Spongiibacter sp.]|tara:strand:- start:1741 stop:2841 length:1101 start_codon:yes stop_codon:yes gene_type:complete